MSLKKQLLTEQLGDRQNCRAGADKLAGALWVSSLLTALLQRRNMGQLALGGAEPHKPVQTPAHQPGTGSGRQRLSQRAGGPAPGCTCNTAAEGSGRSDRMGNQPRGLRLEESGTASCLHFNSKRQPRRPPACPPARPPPFFFPPAHHPCCAPRSHVIVLRGRRGVVLLPRQELRLLVPARRVPRG